MRWEGGNGGRVMRRPGGRFLVLFKSGQHRVSPRFYYFVSDVNQVKKGNGMHGGYIVCPQGWKYSP